ncbi:ribonuclease P protein component [Candidatus Parcubacteria bacterium]|nr:ribonuclease P protein component [Patescibacteria group bacterium]MBU4466662.1 ribonuclease P protein component [Patescibacteria group bacterium]MCG2688035.1 ribonuclease P protein component [Candidatus Parcubacteria bacterium]
MLPSPYRLKKKSDFEFLLKKGKSHSSGLVAIKFIDNSEQNSRFGFLAAKKSFKKATLRNKVRRKLREQLQQRLALIKPGKDIVIIARSGIEKYKSVEVGKQIEILLAQAKLLK